MNLPRVLATAAVGVLAALAAPAAGHAAPSPTPSATYSGVSAIAVVYEDQCDGSVRVSSLNPLKGNVVVDINGEIHVVGPSQIAVATVPPAGRKATTVKIRITSGAEHADRAVHTWSAPGPSKCAPAQPLVAAASPAPTPAGTTKAAAPATRKTAMSTAMLPVTGSQAWRYVLAGVVLVIFGAGLVWFARPRGGYRFVR